MKKSLIQCAKVFLVGLCASTVFSASVFSVNASVSCGSTSDGYRCHYRSTTGTPPPMYHTFGDKTMNYGVGEYGSNRRYYWIDSSFSSSYVSEIQNAVSEWIYTTDAVGVTTSISLRETTDRSSAYFEIVRNDSLGAGVLGRTTFYLYSEEVPLASNGSLSDNYGWTRISLSPDNLGFDSTRIKSTASHELGHGMGLSHQNCRTTSIMCQTKQGRTALRADKIDLQTINHLYG